MFTLKKVLLTVAAGAMLAAPVALADHTAPSPCHTSCEVKLTRTKVWVPARCRIVQKRVFVPACYRTITRNVWIPHRYRTVCKRVYIPVRYTPINCRSWIPARYTWRQIAVRDRCGRVIGYRNIRTKVPGTGRWVNRTKRVKQAGTGCWVTQNVRQLVPGTGVWSRHTERQLVPGTRQYVTRTVKEQIPGTGKFVIRIEKKYVCHAEQFVAAPITTTGFGALRSDISGPRAKLLALRAARLDASRRLAEQLFGLKIKAHTTVKDMVLANDLIASEVEGLVRGAIEVSVKERANGTFAVTLRIDAAALESLLVSVS